MKVSLLSLVDVQVCVSMVCVNLTVGWKEFSWYKNDSSECLLCVHSIKMSSINLLYSVGLRGWVLRTFVSIASMNRLAYDGVILVPIAAPCISLKILLLNLKVLYFSTNSKSGFRNCSGMGKLLFTFSLLTHASIPSSCGIFR